MIAWLPFESAAEAERQLGPIPEGIEVVGVPDPDHAPTDRLDEVGFVAQPYMTGRAILRHVNRMPNLRAVQLSSAGFDGIAELLPAGVALHNAAGVHDAATAELAVGLMIASGRRLDAYARDQAAHRWEPQFGVSLADRRVLIVGAGRIGQAIERRLAGFEVASVTRVARTAREGIHAIDELDVLLPDAEIVCLICPLTPQTRGLMDARRLALLPDDALVVNVARGPIIDTAALVEACGAGRIRAALDVTDPEPLPADHPLWDTPGVLVVPHRGGAATSFHPRFHALLADQLRRLAQGEALRNRVG